MLQEMLLDISFGAVLVIVFLAIILYYYSKKRYDKVEKPKYRMLEDEDDES